MLNMVHGPFYKHGHQTMRTSADHISSDAPALGARGLKSWSKGCSGNNASSNGKFIFQWDVHQ